MDEFLVKDHVLIQNNLNGKWEEEGVIKACRRADDNSIQWYEIKGHTKRTHVERDTCSSS